MIEFASLCVALICLTGAHAVCLDDPKTVDTGVPPIRLGINSWASSNFNVQVAKILLEERMGIPVSTFLFSEGEMPKIFANDTMDGCLEMWTGDISRLQANYKDGSVVDGGLLGVIGRIGWYVPSYIEQAFPFVSGLALASEAQRNALFGAVNNSLLMGSASWVSYEDYIISLNKYNLSMTYSADEAALLTKLRSLYQKRESFLFYLWTPHSIFAELNITRVALPTSTDECENGPNSAHYCDYPQAFLRKSFNNRLAKKNQRASQFLTSLSFTNADHIRALYRIDVEKMSPSQAACLWVKEHQATWSNWIPASSAETAAWKIVIAVVIPVVVLAAALFLALFFVMRFRKRAKVLADDNVRLKGLMKVNVLDTPAERVLLILEELRKKVGKKLSCADVENVDYCISAIASRRLNRVAADAIRGKGISEDVLDYLYSTVLQQESEENVLKATSASSLSTFVMCFAGENADESIVSAIDKWEFDTIAFHVASSGHGLRAMATHLFGRYGLFKSLGLDNKKFAAFIEAAESHYNGNNKYHNSIHAADVTQAVHMLIKDKLSQFTDLQIFSLLFAGTIHDLEHPGRNNGFQVAIKSPLSIEYNDNSVLENMHLARTFALLSQDQYNFMCNVAPDMFFAFRKTVIQLVLATDMARHVEIMSDFKARLAASGGGELDMTSNDAQMSLMRVIIKAADIFNTGRPWEVCKKWAELAAQEFFEQGDEERERGMQVSPMMDRTKTSVPKLQIAFVDYVTLPMAESIAKVLPSVKGIAASMTTNRAKWTEIEALEAQQGTPWLASTDNDPVEETKHSDSTSE